MAESKLTEEALEVFRKWGAEGGRTRKERLSPMRRREIARIAGKAPKKRKK